MVHARRLARQLTSATLGIADKIGVTVVRDGARLVDARPAYVFGEHAETDSLGTAAARAWAIGNGAVGIAIAVKRVGHAVVAATALRLRGDITGRTHRLCAHQLRACDARRIGDAVRTAGAQRTPIVVPVAACAHWSALHTSARRHWAGGAAVACFIDRHGTIVANGDRAERAGACAHRAAFPRRDDQGSTHTRRWRLAAHAQTIRSTGSRRGRRRTVGADSIPASRACQRLAPAAASPTGGACRSADTTATAARAASAIARITARATTALSSIVVAAEGRSTAPGQRQQSRDQHDRLETHEYPCSNFRAAIAHPFEPDGLSQGPECFGNARATGPHDTIVAMPGTLPCQYPGGWSCWGADSYRAGRFCLTMGYRGIVSLPDQRVFGSASVDQCTDLRIVESPPLRSGGALSHPRGPSLDNDKELASSARRVSNEQESS